MVFSIDEELFVEFVVDFHIFIHFQDREGVSGPY